MNRIDDDRVCFRITAEFYYSTSNCGIKIAQDIPQISALLLQSLHLKARTAKFSDPNESNFRQSVSHTQAFKLRNLILHA